MIFSPDEDFQLNQNLCFKNVYCDTKNSYLIQIICTELYCLKYSFLIQIIRREIYGFKYPYPNTKKIVHSYMVSSTNNLHTVVSFQVFLPNTNNTDTVICLKYSYLIQIIYTRWYSFKYSSLIQIIWIQWYAFKYSDQIQIMWTQFYGFKYFYLIQIILILSYGFKYSKIIQIKFYELIKSIR